MGKRAGLGEGGKAGYVSVFHINLPFKFLFSDSWTWHSPFQRLVLAFPEKTPADFCVNEEGYSAGGVPMKRTFSVPHIELTTCSGLCVLSFLSTGTIIEIDRKDGS